MRGDGSIYPKAGSSFLWMKYFVNGEPREESTKQRNEQAARKVLRARLKEVHASEVTGQAFITQKMKRTTIRDLADSHESHLRVEGQLSKQNESELKNVRDSFGDGLALSFTSKHLDEWKEQQVNAGYAKVTVNLTLSFLTRAYRFAIERNELPRMPMIKKLKVSNARKGFLNKPDFERLAVHLPDDGLRDFARFAFACGMRKGEIASLIWSNIQDGTTIELDAENSKNGEGRKIPITGEIAPIIDRRRKARLLADGTLSNLIFHRGDNRPITEFRKSWAKACRVAGLDGQLFHDLRRSAVRNLIRSGVSQSVSMQISGHKTASMFQRYNITDETDIGAGVERSRTIQRTAGF